MSKLAQQKQLVQYKDRKICFRQQKRGKKTSPFLLTGLSFIFNRTGENL